MNRKLWYADGWSSAGKLVCWAEGDISRISKFAQQFRNTLTIRILAPLEPVPQDLVDLYAIGVEQGW